ARLGDGNANLVKEAASGIRVELAAEELLERVEVDWERVELAADKAANFVARRNPVRETRQIREKVGVVGAEIMRAVVVDEDAVAVARVEAIAGEMIAPVDNQHLPAEDAGSALRDGASGRTGSRNEKINVIQHWGLLWSAAVSAALQSTDQPEVSSSCARGVRPATSSAGRSRSGTASLPVSRSRSRRWLGMCSTCATVSGPKRWRSRSR